jgi:transcriptional regulator with XRE-family HTH domain
MPLRRRRRTPGLRREELATLAGVSVDYYARLEQGRETRPSASVLRALAGALGLTDEEHAHLAALAGARRFAHVATGTVEVDPGLLQLLATVRPAPSYLLSRVSDVHAANPEGLAMLPGLTDWPAERRNTVRYLFTHPAAEKLFGDWEGSAASNVAHLRTVLTAEPEAADVAALVAELSEASVDFARLWRRYDVAAWTPKTKTFHHPDVGDFTVDSQTLTVTSTGQRLVVYQAPPDSADHRALGRLA